MKTVILVESPRANGTSFANHLRKRYDLLVANTGKDALDLIQAKTPHILILDAASMRTSGDRICSKLKSEVKNIPIIHIKEGPPPITEESEADLLMYLPFTYRKLWNRIERFTRAREGEILAVGPFSLNLQQSLLTTPQGETKLTPKLARLMELLMRQPNTIVARLTLMQEVWQTNYMGDTRTLDVHIRWLRRAVEENPDKPRYIKTSRGKGYTLVL